MDSPIKGNKDQTSDQMMMQEVANIRRCTGQLEDSLQEKLRGDPVSTAILKELSHYAARASLLLEAHAADDVEAGRGTAVEASIGSPSSVDQSDASVGKRKLPQTGGGRRGGCRRRSQQYTGIKRVESKTLDDGHSWRKYGQKDIQTTKFPRSYFRCTHKHSQGCKAQRQVQKSESEASTFIITYIGEHTCRDPASVLVPSITPASNSKGSFLISFGENTANCLDSTHIRSVPSLKMEHDDEMSSLTTGSSLPSYRLLPEAATPAGIVPIPAPSPPNTSSVFPSPAISYVPMEFDVTETDVEFDDLQDLDVCDYFLAGN